MPGINFGVELLLCICFLGLLKVHMIASFSTEMKQDCKGIPLWGLSLQSTALEMFFIKHTHIERDGVIKGQTNKGGCDIYGQ